ncbi:5-(carboxyamino)imidazole ribonucleotide mutase [Defluviitalea phaphyphila]|uniref:5-(carboxyamino)imidazole ribonucleotide mutase n=1 Tax=Defluviitalea phaphyphila TaxID=1473580 RepID=UPI000731AE23|nr:5-(carboxyamino)imidazole ribonucleotide mutase [Defluviitalea phaphyphila]
MKPLVGIIMGSDSDLPVMSEAAKILGDFGIEYEITIVSAHRTPDRLYEYAKTAKEKGLKVIIAGAGGAAHLPGMVASITTVPVIGVPVKTSTLSGIDSLYSIVQMPPGIPVATVAINGAKNAGILAAQIIGSFDKEIENKVLNYKEDLKNMVENKALKLEKEGFEKYLLEKNK